MASWKEDGIKENPIKLRTKWRKKSKKGKQHTHRVGGMTSQLGGTSVLEGLRRQRLWKAS